MSQLPEYQEQEFFPSVYPAVDQLERTVRQYEPTAADLFGRLSETHDSDSFVCPLCKGDFARAPAALSPCNHPGSLGTHRRPNGNTADCPGRGSIPIPNSHQLNEVLRTMSPGMRQYVTSLEEAYQQKMKEAGTDEKAAIQNLQQRMVNMANSRPDSPRFSWNSSNLPRSAMVEVPRIPTAEGQTPVKLTRSDSSPRKSGFWAAIQRK